MEKAPSTTSVPGLPEAASTETILFGQPRSGSALAPAETLERGAAFGRYVILDFVGRGGMGVVYAAYDPELDRKVALKLLRPDRGEGRPSGRLRLLREAQAIARLSHPNVVTVHDAGSSGDRVFIAMEYVEGRTLRDWLEKERPSWREILDRFLLAGRGLAAAHDAGLIHRDFKPDNVLLGVDGRVRVVDFGLARAAGEPDEERREESGSGALLSSPITQLGVAVGTPAYMAPEQLRGEAADARSDQFSFCVALWEALYGVRPFPGEDSKAVADAMAKGMVRETPAGTRVPGRLREAMLRGLSADPARRYASMGELLRDLERDRSAVRRRWLAAAALALILASAAAGGGYLQARRVQLCGGAEEKLAGTWDAEKKARVRAAFLSTGAPFAETVLRSVEQTLDRAMADWAAMHREACEATRLRGEQSEELLDRRMFCLDQQRREVQALTEVFTRADAKMVEKAAGALNGVADLSHCGRAATLAEKVPPPRDPAVRARVTAVQSELAVARALQRAGKLREALAQAEVLKPKALGLPYPPLRAEMLLLLGKVQLGLGEFELAERELYRAVWAAEEGKDDLTKAEAWRELVYNVGVRQARHEEAHRFARLAGAALARAGGDQRAEMALLRTEASVFSLEGKYQPAIETLEKARALAERIDPRQPDYGILGNLGAIYRDMGKSEKAIPLLRRALEIAETRVGAGHPNVPGLRFNLGISLADLGRRDEAAVFLERALEEREKLLGPDHPDLADTLIAVASNWMERGQTGRAMPLLKRALGIYESRDLKTPHGWAMAHYNLGEAARRLGRYGEALEHERKAMELIEAAVGSESGYLLLPLETLGALHLDQGRPDRAIPPLERAMAIYARQPSAPPGWPADVRFLLARALWEAGQDRPRALALAGQARAIHRRAGATDSAAAVDAWLAGREGGSRS